MKEKMVCNGRRYEFEDGTVIEHTDGGRGSVTYQRDMGNPIYKADLGINRVYIYAGTDPFDIEMYKRLGYKFTKIKYKRS